MRVLVDGGTDRWLTYLQEQNLLDKLEDPELITGDLDSASKESLKYFEDRGSNLIRTPDQNDTDFTKCLRIVFPLIEKHGIESVLVLADSSGRIDQIMANINTLFKIENIRSKSNSNGFVPVVPVYLMSSNSLSWLLVEGTHKIHIPESIKHRWCALIPIGSKCQATTKGLKWNLNNTVMEFGGLVSTSNTYNPDNFTGIVEITTDSPLLWSMGTNSLDD